MEEEYEKRFKEISNKLFHTPARPKPNTTNNNRLLGVQKLIGKKRQNPYLSVRNVVEELGSSLSTEAPSCKPWDRDDLLRRLSTFKAMTWFAKPQAVSPLNCSRRGWINADTDTIGCASCGSRLLFSTPSAWTRQQVEKAAMVFSLKLESGHKLLCPWINSVCTEELAQFPVISQAALVEDYKKRFHALSQLIALPNIAPVAIDTMRSPELEQFLRECSTPGHNGPIETSATELSLDVPESDSTFLYYQAQKLISLCGWESRVLSYIVDFKDGMNQFIKNADVRLTDGLKRKTHVYSLCAKTSEASPGLQFDPSSVVLDCKLCGSSVGLWAFSTVLQPIEYLRFVELAEVHGKNDTTHAEVSAQGSSSNTVTTASTSLGFTIAGGPTPEMLKYRATISFPVIGQSLRSRLLAETKSGDETVVQRLSRVEEGYQMILENANVTGKESFATTGPDFIVENPIHRQIVEENSISTIETINSPVAGHHRFEFGELSCSTPEDHTANRNSVWGDPNRVQIVQAENYEQNISQTLSQGENKNLPSLSKSMEFDPIKQHRHFCPWIVSSGKFAPGWKETLNALVEHKEFPVSPLNSVPSSSWIEVDDPIASVKKLFASPNAKRTKFSDGS